MLLVYRYTNAILIYHLLRLQPMATIQNAKLELDKSDTFSVAADLDSYEQGALYQVSIDPKNGEPFLFTRVKGVGL